MTTATGHPGLTPTGPGDPSSRVVQVSDELRLHAAARLVADQGGAGGDPLEAARRFLDSAGMLGMDLSLMWATVEPSGGNIRQVCLAVTGAGRTVMLFLSGPQRRHRAWSPGRLRQGWSAGADAQDHQDRVTLLRHACRAVADSAGARLAQSLLEVREREAIAAFRDAGFTQLGDLAYLRRALPRSWGEGDAAPSWSAGVRVESVADLRARGASEAEVDAAIEAALERSYEQTQDCPELCGLREVSDVLESHRSVGVHDPALWWIVFDGDRAEGCVLLSPCPEHDSVELVYLGLSPRMRGRSLGAALLRFGVANLYRHTIRGADSAGVPDETARVSIGGTGGVTCAVDTRNAPAMRLYKRAGFQRFGLRIPMVRGLGPDRG